jgi:hypothetical protein
MGKAEVRPEPSNTLSPGGRFRFALQSNQPILYYTTVCTSLSVIIIIIIITTRILNVLHRASLGQEIGLTTAQMVHIKM